MPRKQPAAVVPFGASFVRGKPQQLERMTIRILELVRLDASRSAIGFRDRLRRAGDALQSERAQMLVCFVHVAHHDCEVLEPQIVGAAVDRDRLAAGGDVLLELNLLLAELQRGHAYSRAEYSG